MVPSLGTPTEHSDGGGSAGALNFAATASPIEPFREMFNDLATR